MLASALVAHQPGTVVSRTLVRKPSGTVTVFAFDAGEGLGEHTAPFDALALSLEGEAEISIATMPPMGTFSEDACGIGLRLLVTRDTNRTRDGDRFRDRLRCMSEPSARRPASAKAPTQVA